MQKPFLLLLGKRKIFLSETGSGLLVYLLQCLDDILAAHILTSNPPVLSAGV